MAFIDGATTHRVRNLAWTISFLVGGLMGCGGDTSPIDSEEPSPSHQVQNDCPMATDQDASYACTATSPSAPGTSLTWALHPSNTCAWATISAQGRVSGRPNNSHVGDCILALWAPGGGSAVSSRTVTVHNVAPTLNIANTTATAGAGPAVIRNDAAVQASEEGYGTYALDNAGTSGTRCADHGTLRIDATNGSITFAPNADFSGACDIRVVFDDGHRVNNTVAAQFTVTVTGSGANPAWQPRSSLRLFVSGHSLTDNPFVEYIGQIASSRSDSYNHNQQIVIGSPIRVRSKGDNWNATGWPGYSAGKNRNGSTGLNVIHEFLAPRTLGSNEKYDTLVLTENHNSLDMIQWEDTLGLTRHYHDRFISGNPRGRGFLFHPWLDIDKSAPTAWITHEKNALIVWECVASKVNHSLSSDGRSDRMVTLPAGGALVDLVERVVAGQVAGFSGTTAQKLNMLFIDNVHMTQLGMYYMALVTYAATYGKSPVGAAIPSGLNETAAAAIQPIEWNYIHGYYNRANPGVRTMNECRTHIASNVCSSYWTLKGDTQKIPGCQNFFGNSNPNAVFRWPDANYTPWPAP